MRESWALCRRVELLRPSVFWWLQRLLFSDVCEDSVRSQKWIFGKVLFRRKYRSGWWVQPFSTHLKNISQNGNLPQLGVKIKNIWNHHLEMADRWLACCYVPTVAKNPRILPHWEIRTLTKDVRWQSHTIHVWYIYLHLAKIYGKCI